MIRGAPCGATWGAAQRILGMAVDEAGIGIGLSAQMFCTANPSGWDVLKDKSPVHLAGDLHKSALDKAIKKEIISI